MKAQLESQITSNFLLLIDHIVQQAGAAYQNYSGQFFPVSSDIGGMYAYASPYKPICNDSSVSGCQVLSGLYVNNTYTPIGSGHFKMFNPYKGVAYFNQPVTVGIVSGNYAIKEFSVHLSDQTEWKLLFETQYTTSKKYNQTISGLDPTVKTTPIIWLAVKNQQNEGWAFGHADENILGLRCIIVADNEFQCMNATSILKNTFRYSVPMVTAPPFDSLGNTTGANYNYKKLGQDPTFVWIKDAKAIDVPQKKDFKDIPYKNFSIVDFTLSTVVQNPASLP